MKNMIEKFITNKVNRIYYYNFYYPKYYYMLKYIKYF